MWLRASVREPSPCRHPVNFVNFVIPSTPADFPSRLCGRIFRNEPCQRFSAYRRALVFAWECGHCRLGLRRHSRMGDLAFAVEYGPVHFRNTTKAPPVTQSPPRRSWYGFSAVAGMVHDLECQSSIHQRSTGFCGSPTTIAELAGVYGCALGFAFDAFDNGTPWSFLHRVRHDIEPSLASTPLDHACWNRWKHRCPWTCPKALGCTINFLGFGAKSRMDIFRLVSVSRKRGQFHQSCLAADRRLGRDRLFPRGSGNELRVPNLGRFDHCGGRFRQCVASSECALRGPSGRHEPMHRFNGTPQFGLVQTMDPLVTCSRNARFGGSPRHFI